MNLEQMTVAELEAELARLTAERAALRERALTVHAVLDRKQAEQRAMRTLAGLSDVERAALAQVVQAQGVESGERVVGF